jgi:hypothetical protein
MKHLRQMTVRPAMEKQDAAGMIFLQLWFFVLSLMLTAAFGDK